MSNQTPLAIDPAGLAQRDRYKLLVGLIIPRPIALVTTLGPGGILNAAPFSFFNLFSDTPPLIVLGLESKPDGSLKDTTAHIRDRGSFVVNLVDEELGECMNTCAIAFPPEISEVDAAGLTSLPSVRIPVPRIAEAPAALECRHTITLEISRSRRLAVGEIVYVHVRPGVVDPDRLHVDMNEYRPLARLYGDYYASLGEPFTHKRRTYEEWATANAISGGKTALRREPS